MWQQSHGCWPSLMRRTLCLTNYPGGQTTCFSNAIFFCPLSHTLSGYFSPQLLSTRTEPWHAARIFAFELALLITAYWSPFPPSFTVCLKAFYFLSLSHFLSVAFPTPRFSHLDSQTAVYLYHRSPRRGIMHKTLFDMKSIISKVDQRTHKCTTQQGIIDCCCIGPKGRGRRKDYI